MSNHSLFLMNAAKYGEINTLRQWVERNGEPIPSMVLANAAGRGHMECVRYLLPLVPQKAIDEGLIHASIEGKMAIAQLLTGYCSDTNTFNVSAFHACINNRADIFSILYSLCHPDNVQHRLQQLQFDEHHPQAQLFYERHRQEQLRQTLMTEVGVHPTRTAKM